MALILDGKKIRDEIADNLKYQISDKVKEGFVRPSLAIIQVGNIKESEAYIKNKKKFGERVGVEVIHIHLADNVEEDDVLAEIKNLNDDEAVHGVIVQMPLPKHLNKNKLIEAILPRKDVDGMCATNIKGLWIDSKETIMPATTRGILTMLDKNDIEISGKNVVIVGRSVLVGRPTALAMINRNATVTLCHTFTKNLEFHTLDADIIVSAVGRPRLITEFHVKPHQVIVDVGITIEDTPETRSVGDVDFENVEPLVDAISPVPGGVGPMTVASLFENLFDAYKKVI